MYMPGHYNRMGLEFGQGTKIRINKTKKKSFNFPPTKMKFLIHNYAY